MCLFLTTFPTPKTTQCSLQFPNSTHYSTNVYHAFIHKNNVDMSETMRGIRT